MDNIEKIIEESLAQPGTTKLFDLKRLRLAQDYSTQVSVKKIITTVPVHKPNRQDFFRVKGGDDWQLPTAVIELKEDRETYLVAPELRNALAGEFVLKILFVGINRQGVIFLWPVKLPTEDGRTDNWSRSALEAASIASEKWVRMQANMSLGAYDVFQAAGNLGEPDWPEITFDRLIEIAFQERYIDSLEHPVLKRLRGEV